MANPDRLSGLDASFLSLERSGAHMHVGSVLLFDPLLDDQLHLVQPVTACGPSAVMPLTPEGLLITALAEDTLELRRHLSAGLTAVGPPWHP